MTRHAKGARYVETLGGTNIAPIRQQVQGKEVVAVLQKAEAVDGEGIKFGQHKRCANIPQTHVVDMYSGD